MKVPVSRWRRECILLDGVLAGLNILKYLKYLDMCSVASICPHTNIRGGSEQTQAFWLRTYVPKPCLGNLCALSRAPPQRSGPSAPGEALPRGRWVLALQLLLPGELTKRSLVYPANPAMLSCGAPEAEGLGRPALACAAIYLEFKSWLHGL